MTSSLNYFAVVLFLLSSLVTVQNLITSLLVLELWNLEIPLSEFCLISGDWGGIRDTKFGKDVFNEMLLNAAKCQGYGFYQF